MRFLGLALAASLWWLYFNGDEERAHRAMERAPEERRPWLAVQGFGYIFLPILGGIVVVAAGMKLAVVGYDEPATLATALLLASGVAAYAFGLVLFQKRPQIARGIEQPHPLFVIKCHRESPQPVNAYAAFLSDAEFELPALAPSLLLLELSNPRSEFLIGWFCHCSSSVDKKAL